MRSAVPQLQLSARTFHRVLKIARTIADLAGSDDIALAHPSAALRASSGRGDSVSAEKAGINGVQGDLILFDAVIMLTPTHFGLAYPVS
jgi:hypothetical protein